MRIAITGSTGLIGSALTAQLTAAGHAITRIVRDATPASDGPTVRWDPSQRTIDAAGLEDHDAVIHLAGVNIAASRWTDEFIREIRASRVDSTALLSETLASLRRPPRVLVSASAAGYYGHVEAPATVDETAPPGDGILADLTQAWEHATAPAASAGVRVVNPRIGMVVSPKGGALAKMLPIFRGGLGGRVGPGTQMVSWMALEEIAPAVLHVIDTESLAGPVNFVTPSPVSNAEMARVLGRVLHRPALMAMPAFAARLAFGRMADELLLSGAAIVPARLLDTGYTFRWPEFEPALRHMLAEPTA